MSEVTTQLTPATAVTPTLPPAPVAQVVATKPAPVMTASDRKLLAILKKNQNRWYSTDRLARMLKFPSHDGAGQKAVINARRRIVKAGFPIASSPKGYMYSNSADVFERSIKMYLRKISGMQDTVKQLRARAEEAAVDDALQLVRQMTLDSIQLKAQPATTPQQS